MAPRWFIVHFVIVNSVAIMIDIKVGLCYADLDSIENMPKRKSHVCFYYAFISVHFPSSVEKTLTSSPASVVICFIIGSYPDTGGMYS